MIEENNASSGAVESSAQQSQAEAKPAQSELTAQDILAASTNSDRAERGESDTLTPAGFTRKICYYAVT